MLTDPNPYIVSQSTYQMTHGDPPIHQENYELFSRAVSLKVIGYFGLDRHSSTCLISGSSSENSPTAQADISYTQLLHIARTTLQLMLQMAIDLTPLLFNTTESQLLIKKELIVYPSKSYSVHITINLSSK
jgi:hypothetical protein